MVTALCIAGLVGAVVVAAAGVHLMTTGGVFDWLSGWHMVRTAGTVAGWLFAAIASANE